jgi:RNA polymerase sigma-70 factor (ECF subfamily)
MSQDAAMFVELVRSYGPRLQRLAGSYARGEDRHDLLQQMWLQVWRALPGCRGDAAISTWAYRIALNTAVSYVRGEIRRREHTSGAAAPEPAVAGGRDERAILDEFLAGRGPIDRSVMLLYLEGLTPAHVAQVTGHTEGAIAVRLTRLKAAF